MTKRILEVNKEWTDKIFDTLNFQISAYGDNESLVFSANDIGKYLNIHNIRDCISEFTDDEKQYNITCTNGGTQLINVLSIDGLKRLVSVTRKCIPKEFSTLFGIYQYEHRYIPKEIAFLSALKRAFKDIEMIDQYYVDKYRIDVYIPAYKLAIEFDELQHERQKEADEKRQQYIEDKLKCKFLRVRENDDIFDAIYKIRMELMVIK
jgi:very-short-patch-repair endonuclease